MVIVIALLVLMGALAGGIPSIGDVQPVSPATSAVLTMGAMSPSAILSAPDCRSAGATIRDLSQPFAAQTAAAPVSACGAH